MIRAMIMPVAAVLLIFGAANSVAQEKGEKQAPSAAPLIVEELEIGKALGLSEVPTMLYSEGRQTLVVEGGSLLASDGGPFTPVKLEDGTPVVGRSLSLVGSMEGLFFVAYGVKKDELALLQMVDGKAKYWRIVTDKDLRRFFVVGTTSSGSVCLHAQWYDDEDNDRYFALCTTGNELRHVLTPEGKAHWGYHNVHVDVLANGKCRVSRPSKNAGVYESFWVEEAKMVPIEEPPLPKDADPALKRTLVTYEKDCTFVFSYDSGSGRYLGWIVRGKDATWITDGKGARQRFQSPVTFQNRGSYYVSESPRLESFDKGEAALFKLTNDVASVVNWKPAKKLSSIRSIALPNGCLILGGTKDAFERWTINWLTEEGVTPIEFQKGAPAATEGPLGASVVGGFVLFTYWGGATEAHMILDGPAACGLDLSSVKSWSSLGEKFAVIGDVLLCSWIEWDHKRDDVTDPGVLSALDKQGKPLTLTDPKGKRIEGKEVIMAPCANCVYVVQRGKDFRDRKLLRIKAKQ